jgi:hypothetical protein
MVPLAQLFSIPVSQDQITNIKVPFGPKSKQQNLEFQCLHFI